VLPITLSRLQTNDYFDYFEYEVQDLAGLLEVFAQCDYEIELVSPERDCSTAINRGLRVTGGTDFRTFDRPIDTLWVVGGPEAPSGRYDQAYLRWLKEMSLQARRVGASYLGTFVLAASGALEGRRAVTHWQWLDHLAERYPGVELVRSSIFVKDGHIETSAGITTGIDLALLFVEEVSAHARLSQSRSGSFFSYVGPRATRRSASCSRCSPARSSRSTTWRTGSSSISLRTSASNAWPPSAVLAAPTRCGVRFCVWLTPRPARSQERTPQRAHPTGT